MLDKEHENIEFNFLSAEEQGKGKDKMVKVKIKDLIKNKKLNDVHGYWLGEIYNLFISLGLNPLNLRVREHVKNE